MIISFTIKNIFSFKDVQTLNFISNNRYRNHKNYLLDTPDPKIKLLKNIVICGANYNSQTDMINALNCFRDLLLYSENKLSNPIEDIKPFISKENEDNTTFFEIEFFCNDCRYLYSVELNNQKVFSENFYYFPKNYKKTIFTRKLINGNEYEYNFCKELKHKFIYKYVASKTKKNVLFLSNIMNEELEYFNNIKNYFLSSLCCKFSHDTLINKILKDKNYKKDFIKFIKNNDINIDDVKIEEITLLSELYKYGIEIPMDIYNTFENKLEESYYKIIMLCSLDNKESCKFDYSSISNGTKKLMKLSQIFLNDSSFFCIKDFNDGLHPLLVKKLVKEFNINKNNQLICTINNTNLLDHEILRPDQVCFIETDETLASNVYYLSYLILKENWNAYHLSSKYGEIPYIEK